MISDSVESVSLSCERKVHPLPSTMHTCNNKSSKHLTTSNSRLNECENRFSVEEQELCNLQSHLLEIIECVFHQDTAFFNASENAGNHVCLWGWHRSQCEAQRTCSARLLLALLWSSSEGHCPRYFLNPGSKLASGSHKCSRARHACPTCRKSLAYKQDCHRSSR